MKTSELFVLLLGLSLTCTIRAQPLPADSIYFAGNWSPGSQVHYQIEKETKSSRNGNPQIWKREIFRITFTVESISTDHLLFSFRVDSARLGEKVPEPDQTDLLFYQLLPQLRFVFQTDEFAQFQALTNFQEIREKASQFLKNRSGNNTTDEVHLMALKALFATQTGVEDWLLDHTIDLFPLYGFNFPINYDRSWQDLLPNSPGGEELPVSCRETVRVADTLVQYAYEALVDKDSMAGSIAASVERSSRTTLKDENQRKAAMESAKKVFYELKDQGAMVFSRNGGWPLESHWSRNIVAELPPGLDLFLEQVVVESPWADRKNTTGLPMRVETVDRIHFKLIAWNKP